MVQNFHEFSERNKALETEKAAMAQHVAKLKGRMANVRQGASRRLVNLSLDVRDARKKVKERLDLGQRLLQLAEKARALETDKEKVQPYYQSSATPTEDEKEQDAEASGNWLRELVVNGGFSEVTAKAVSAMADPATLGALDNFYKK